MLFLLIKSSTKTLTKNSKIIFFLALVIGTLAAYLARINYHPAMTYVVDISLVFCTLGLIFWRKK